MPEVLATAKFITDDRFVFATSKMEGRTNAAAYRGWAPESVILSFRGTQWPDGRWDVEIAIFRNPGMRNSIPFAEVIPPDASWSFPDEEAAPIPEKVPIQIFHQAASAPREIRFIAQRLIGDNDELQAWIKEAQKLTPPPPGFKWAVEDENGEHFR